MTGPWVPRFLFLIHLKFKGIAVSSVRKYTVHSFLMAHTMPMPIIHNSNRCCYCCCYDDNAPTKTGPCIIRSSRTSELICPSSEKEKCCGSKGSPELRGKCQGCASLTEACGYTPTLTAARPYRLCCELTGLDHAVLVLCEPLNNKTTPRR
jgi:hypothetical protein